MAAGSMGAASVIPAIHGAVRALKTKIIRAACQQPGSLLHGLSEDEVVWHSPADIRAVESAAAVTAADFLGPGAAPYWEAEYTSSPSESDMSRSAFGACFARVDVDKELGLVRLLQVTGVYAAGQILNRQLAKSQLIGGIVMGIGAALTERVDEHHITGLPLNRSLGSYRVPTNADIAVIDVHLLAEHDRNASTAGIKGIGMIGSVGVTAAIANAVFDATGLRVRDLPLSIDKILASTSFRKRKANWHPRRPSVHPYGSTRMQRTPCGYSRARPLG
jgi:xanthine dehydrogenase YagR molybdenum-binding subunit